MNIVHSLEALLGKLLTSIAAIKRIFVALTAVIDVTVAILAPDIRVTTAVPIALKNMVVATIVTLRIMSYWAIRQYDVASYLNGSQTPRGAEGCARPS